MKRKILDLNKVKNINVYLINNDFLYEIEGVCRLFFPHTKLEFHNIDKFVEFKSDFLCISIDKTKNSNIILSVNVNIDSIQTCKTINVNDYIHNRDIELYLSRMLFKILSEITDIKPEWGIITGVRPVKLFRSLLLNNGIEYSIDYFKNKFLVSEQKIRLAIQVSINEKKILELSKPTSFSLYISIPFCPSRCSYCSFVSQSVEKAYKLIPKYIELLLQEINITSQIVKDLGLRLETVYIGGGTPTSLSPNQLETIILEIIKNFNMQTCREFTIEAGRPDTLSPEMLNILRSFKGVRISVNPQTFNNDILYKIGRKHTADDTIKAFNLARNSGINNINMDLIAGLPEESYESFCNTLEQALNLSPESITVHTLSIKRAAKITEQYKQIFNSVSPVDKMLKKAYKELCQSMYFPYYLYRQSKMLGNMENTGWSKKGFEGLYNIYIMDEIHTILACGAGASTKLKNPFNNNIERIFNFKFAYEYISRFNEIIERKGKVKNFYEKFQ